jgi:hypothetical protein
MVRKLAHCGISTYVGGTAVGCRLLALTHHWSHLTRAAAIYTPAACGTTTHTLPEPSTQHGPARPHPQTAAQQLAALQAFQLPGGIRAANVLLLGPAGAGKSSLVSSLDSILKGKMTRRADYGGATKSLTMDLRAYKFAAGGTKLPLVMWDTRGWCPESYITGEPQSWLDWHSAVACRSLC